MFELWLFGLANLEDKFQKIVIYTLSHILNIPLWFIFLMTLRSLAHDIQHSSWILLVPNNTVCVSIFF